MLTTRTARWTTATAASLLAAASVMTGCETTGNTDGSASAQASPGAAGATHQTTLSDRIGGELVTADGETVSSDTLANNEFVVLYFSAGWCGPCKRYTPTLIEFYEEYGDDVEVILVSSDRNADDMFEYMNDAGMPWLALPYDRIDDSGLKSTYEVRGIPRVVVFNRDHQVVMDSNDVNRNEIPERVAQMLY